MLRGATVPILLPTVHSPFLYRAEYRSSGVSVGFFTSMVIVSFTWELLKVKLVPLTCMSSARSENTVSGTVGDCDSAVDEALNSSTTININKACDKRMLIIYLF